MSWKADHAVTPVPCPLCDGPMTDHDQHDLATGAYYIHRYCEACNAWDLDEDGGI